MKLVSKSSQKNNMRHFKCWSPDNGSEQEDADPMEFPDWMDAEDAASEYADKRFYDWEQPTDFDVFVAPCNKEGVLEGPVFRYNITVDYEPSFHVVEIE